MFVSFLKFRTYFRCYLSKSFSNLSHGINSIIFKKVIWTFVFVDSGDIEDPRPEDPRLLGLAMVPGRHIQSMYIDMDRYLLEELQQLKNDANTPAEVTPTFDDSVTMGDETSEMKDEREEATVK